MSEEGKLFDYANLEIVDDFSRSIYEDLKDWPLAQSSGRWSTWSGAPYYPSNYLLLELIVSGDGEPSEPACLYSADEELTFATRGWEDHGPFDPDESPSAYARKVAEQWFSRQFFIASYYRGEVWKGTITIPATADLRHELRSGLEWVRTNFEANRLELKGPYKSADRIYTIGASGIEFSD